MALGIIERDLKNPNVTELSNYRNSLRLARIIEVYDASYLQSAASADKAKYGKVKVMWLDGKCEIPRLLDVCKPWFSWKYGSAIVAMPEKDDIVVCLARNDSDPVILGFLPNRWGVASSKNKSESDDSIGNIRPLNSGEVLIKSSSQAEIILSKNGNIRFTVSDPSNTSPVVNELNGNTTDYLFSRVKSSDSRVFECLFGYDLFDNGNLNQVGSSSQVCSIGTYSKSNIVMNFPFSKSISFTLNDDTLLETIDSVQILKSTSKSEFIGKNRYSLSERSIYTPGSLNSATDNFKPCSIEKNSCLYTLTFTEDVKYQSNDIVSITCSVKTFLSGLRLNSMGDVFIDGRNIIMRSKDGKASLSLTDSGMAELRGINTTVGNSYSGKVVCNDSGVSLSKGIIEAASVQDTDANSFIDQNGTYFYILDCYPLVKLYKQDNTWVFSGVSKEEYQSLDDIQKTNIQKMWISTSNKLVTQEFLDNLIQEGFPAYSTLKSSL